MSKEELLPCPGAENFICFLIDTAEGSTISEEYLQSKYADFLRSRYNTRPDSKPFKWKGPDEWAWSVKGYSEKPVTFLTAFNAGRERKEG